MREGYARGPATGVGGPAPGDPDCQARGVTTCASRTINVMAKRKTDAPTDPDKLIRQAAGDYRTADDRFEVRQADVGWFLVDSEQANEFGQELIHGPFGTMKAVRAAIPGARGQKATTLRRRKKPTKVRAAPAPPPPPPPSWIDKLPLPDARAVRKAIAALEHLGVSDAEELVRRDRDGLMPAVAVRLIEERLEAIVAEAPPRERERTRALVRLVAVILTSEGTTLAQPLPRWTLIEIGPADEAPKHRRIDLR